MTGRQIAGVVCFILAAALLVSGISTVAAGPSVTNPSGVGVSHAVGALLPALIALIVGLWLVQKPRPRGEQDQKRGPS